MRLLWYPGGVSDHLTTFPGTNEAGTVAYTTPQLDYAGFSGAPVSHQSVRSPGQHGSTWLETLYDARELSFSAFLEATSLQDLLDAQREVIGAFDVGYGIGVLVWEQEDGSKYRINCIAHGKCPTSLSGETDRLPYSQKLLFTLLAHDPFWYSGVPKQAIFTFTTKAFFPFNFPFNFQGAQSPAIDIVNSGSHNTPVYLKLTGPITDPVLTNNLTGTAVGLDLEILDGETFEVSTDENDLYAVYNATGGEEQGFQYLSATTLLREFYLRSGTNECVLTCSASGAGASALLRWSDKYAGV